MIGVELLINVELEVKMTDPGVKGTRPPDKPAEVEIGAMVTVPLYSDLRRSL